MQKIEASQLQSSPNNKGGPSSPRLMWKLKRPWQLLLAFIELPFRFVFGRDLFISYSRSDSRKYAPNLALALQKRMPKLSFYLDRWIAPPSGKLPLSLRVQLRWSSIMVVICTQNAIGSNFVKDEVARFATLGRKVLTVDVDGAFNAVRGQEPWVGFSGADPEEESVEAIRNGDPSENVVERILKMVEFTTQDRRLRRAVWGTLMFVALSVGGAAAYSFVTVNAANKKVDDARKQAEAAEDRAKTANDSAILAAQHEADAKASQQVAERKAIEAAGKADAAEKLRVSAEAKASDALAKERDALAEAAKQQNIATAGRLAAENILVPEPILEQVERKVLFTIESLRRAPSSTAYRNLIEGIKIMPRALDTATHDGAVKDVLFSADGRYMVIVAGDALWLRSVQGLSRDGKLGAAQKISDAERIAVARFSPNGKYLAAASSDRVNLWRADTMQKLQPIEHKGARAIAFSQDGELIVVGGAKPDPASEATQKTASVWRLGDNVPTEIASVSSIDAVIDVSLSPDKLLFTTLSGDGLKRWKTDGGHQELAHPEARNLSDTLRAGGLSPNGKYLFLIDTDDRTYGTVTRADNDQNVFRGQLDFVEFSPDGRFLVTTSSDDETQKRETRIWDTTDELKELSRIDYRSIIINGEFSRDGKLLALVSLENDSAEIWDTLSGRLLTYVKLKERRPLALAFTPDGKYIAVTAGNEVSMWPLSRDWKTGEVKHGEGPTAISADGKRIALADDKTVRLLNVSDGLEIFSVETRCEVESLALDWQGQRVATAGRDCGVSVWATGDATQNPLDLPKGIDSSDINGLSFSPDGQDLAIATEEDVTIYKIAAPSRSRRLRIGSAVSVALSADGRRLVTVDLDGVKIRDISTPNKNPIQIEHPMMNSESNAMVATFTQDGKLVTADDYIVRIWDVTGMKPVEIGKVTLQEGSTPDTAHAILSPNGAFVAKTIDFPIKDVGTSIWPLNTEALITTACRRLRRSLSETEWNEVFGAATYRETCPGLMLSNDDQ